MSVLDRIEDASSIKQGCFRLVIGEQQLDLSLFSAWGFVSFMDHVLGFSLVWSLNRYGNWLK